MRITKEFIKVLKQSRSVVIRSNSIDMFSKDDTCTTFTKDVQNFLKCEDWYISLYWDQNTTEGSLFKLLKAGDNVTFYDEPYFTNIGVNALNMKVIKHKKGSDNAAQIASINTYLLSLTQSLR
jgi:hypothetical protein